ncbi:hypothetical protein ABZ545_01425 [Streptomyces abikoensis]|uniref:hypothetical protein n=1 Tax=Streptomyces abikoensis TaxID=97398 RepID=UPI0033BFE649
MTAVADVVVERSGMAPLWVVREVEVMAPKAAAAVEGHFGVPLPPVTVVVAGRPGLATARLVAAGWRRGSLRARAAYWWRTYREAAGALGLTAVTSSDRVLVGVSGPLHRERPEDLWRTLVHELAHAMQMDRPGRRAELQALTEHELRLRKLPAGLCWGMDAVVAVEEAEAYAVQHALDPKAEPQVFDIAVTARRLEDSMRCWTSAALSYQSV